MAELDQGLDGDIAASEKDAPLQYDIRLLGRILGQVVKEHEGDAAFDTIERLRRVLDDLRELGLRVVEVPHQVQALGVLEVQPVGERIP